MSRGRALLIGLAVLGFGAVGYGVFSASGLEAFSAGIAASAALMVVVLGWTGSYLLRAVTGNMTYMRQRRDYRAAYDAFTSEELERRFASLSAEEQERLLREAGQVETTGEA